MRKGILKRFSFESSSSPGTFYETLVYGDGSSSCNCPGWTRRVQKDGSRLCKHTKSVASGQTGLASDTVTLKNIASHVVGGTFGKAKTVIVPSKTTVVFAKPRRVINLDDD